MARRKTTKSRPRKAAKQSLSLIRRKRILYGILLVAAVTVLVAIVLTISNSPSGRLVTFHDRGQDHVILTRATTVRAALKDAQITVAAQDVVEPSVESDLKTSDSAVIIYRSRPVLVVDGALRQKVITAAAAPNEIATTAGLPALGGEDKTSFSEGELIRDGASLILTIERSAPPDPIAANAPTPQALTASKGAQVFVDSAGVAHRETYYDLPMNIVINACGSVDYTIRYDGAKVDKDGYILVAANYRSYPKCSIVETSMGLGKVYDTGGFALRYPHGFDLATDWTNFNGR